MDNITSFTRNLIGNSSETNNRSVMYPISPIGFEYYTAYNIYLYIIIVLGVVGNLIVLVVFFKNRPSTTTDWFILSITVCDFLSSFINVPIFVTFTNGHWQIYGTTFICRLQMFLSQSTVLSSSFLICALALDRYLKICKHLSSFTTVRARNVCLSITVLTTVLSMPAFVMYENRGGKCEAIIMNITLFLYYLSVFMIFIFATIVVVFSYFKVTKAVIDSESNIARHSERFERSGRNKHICCYFLYKRTNIVAPSTTTTSRGELFRVSSTTSKNVQTKYDKDHLQVPKIVHMRTISQGHVASVSGLCPEGVTENTQTCSRPFDNQLRKRKTASLRTTKISFLVCSVFILSWIPPWLCFVLASIPGMKSNVNVLKFMMFGKMTYLINGFSNPIIYTLLNKSFRTRILEIFCPCQV